MRRARWGVVAAVLLLAASAVAGVAEPRLVHAADAPATRTITVVGSGTAATVPDRASFGFAVESRATTAKDALAKNATATAAMLAALKNAGVAAADLQTTGVWLSPTLTMNGTVTGYVASNSVNATIAIAKAGPLVDAAVAAGATSVYGPNMLVPDEAALYRSALKDAIANAQGKASALASAGGLTLGNVRTISEGVQATPYPSGGAVSAPSTGSVTPTPIEPGTHSVSATVTVTYDAG